MQLFVSTCCSFSSVRKLKFYFVSSQFYLSALSGSLKTGPSHVLCALEVVLSPEDLGVCHQGISVCVWETWQAGLPTALSRRPALHLHLPCAIQRFPRRLVNRRLPALKALPFDTSSKWCPALNPDIPVAHPQQTKHTVKNVTPCHEWLLSCLTHMESNKTQTFNDDFGFWTENFCTNS